MSTWLVYVWQLYGQISIKMFIWSCFRMWLAFTSVVQFSSVQSLSCVWIYVMPWTTACQASLSITNSWSSLKLTSIESVMPSNHLILCHPLLLLTLIFPSIRVFSSESVLRTRWPKYWSFSFSISPSNEYSGLISFRIDRLDLLAVQGTLKSLLQHRSSKASILWRSFSSVHFSSSVVSDSATPWTAACQAPLAFTISQSLLKFMSIQSVMPSNHLSSVAPFSSWPQSFPESGSFPMSHLFTSGGQSIGVSASASVLPMNIQG